VERPDRRTLFLSGKVLGKGAVFKRKGIEERGLISFSRKVKLREEEGARGRKGRLEKRKTALTEDPRIPSKWGGFKTSAREGDEEKKGQFLQEGGKRCI